MPPWTKASSGSIKFNCNVSLFFSVPSWIVAKSKSNNTILNKLNENQDIYKSSYIEHKYHSKNIRDLLEIFSDIIIKDKSKEDPFIESRMHNRMWRHSIKNIDDIKGIQQCKLMDVYKNFNSK